MSVNGLLSVVVPTCGRPVSVLDRAVSSVLAQTYHSLQVVVVDDNRGDSELSDQIRSYCRSRGNVIHVKATRKHGACVARNLGIEHAQGAFIGFLDDDDEWEVDKAELQIASLTEDAHLSFCRGTCIDEVTKPPQIRPYYNQEFFRPVVKFEDMLLNDCIGTTSQVIMRRDVLTVVGGFDENLLARQDYELWIRISQRFKCVGVDKALFKHYMHSGSQISKSPKRVLQGYKHIYKKYRPHYRARPEARKNILRHIFAHASHSRSLSDMLVYGVAYACLFPEAIGKLLGRAGQDIRR